MKSGQLLDKVEKLEARVRELEAKPPQILSYPVYVPYPHYVWPSVPYCPQPYTYQPFSYSYQGVAGNQGINNYVSYSGMGSING
jgi:hypothetical protein